MKAVLSAFIILGIWQFSYGKPVTKNEAPDPLDAIHYAQYLKEVVSILENDKRFKEVLEKASEDDIKSGKIAEEIEQLGVDVRSILTERKNAEVERLLKLRHSLTDYEHNMNRLEDPLHGHLDLSEPKFEASDLKKLIAKTAEDLADIDRRRRDEFKQYELHKEYEKQDKINHTENVDERAKLEKYYEDLESKHKQHKPLHQPGHQPQLEEVWREQDHMQQKFDPVVFFSMHDPNSDGYWDQNEVKALFIKELNKLYESGVPEDDLRERAEEMERMREAVFTEMDTNKDGLISFTEFKKQTQQNDFKQDHGWKGIDQQGRQFTEEEYQDYVRQQYMQQPPYGQYPPHAQYYPNQQHQGYAPHPGQGQHPGQYYQQPHAGQPPAGGQYHQPVQPQPPYQAHPGQHIPNQQGQQYQQMPNQPQPGQQYQQMPNQPQPGQHYQQMPNQPSPNQQYQQIPNQPQVAQQYQAPNQPPAQQFQQAPPVPPPVQQQPQANQPPLQVNPPQAASDPPKPIPVQAP